MLGTEESVCARAHSPHLRPRHHSQTELGVDQRGSRLGEVALVRQQAASAETTRTAQLEGGQTANLQTGFLSLLSDCSNAGRACSDMYLVKVFGPLGVQMTVRLL